MQVILLEDVQNLGALGDNVRVKAGFARNFLIPKGKAVVATPASVAEFESRRAELEAQQAAVVDAARTRAEAIEGAVVTVFHKAGEGGKLFGSVGSGDVVEALGQAGHEVARTEVRLPGESIREVGEFPVVIHVHPGVEASITLNVEAGS